MRREIEIKLRAPDLASIVSKLEELGCTISVPQTQEDRNFVHKDDASWFETKKINSWVYPRLRIQEGQPLTFTAKKPLQNQMDCLEHEVQIDDPEELTAIMEMFEYRPSIIVKKTRRTCTLQDYTITLDEVDRLGSFIEIERIVEEGDAEKIQEEMFRFAKETFGLDRDDHTMKGYDILMHELENKEI